MPTRNDRAERGSVLVIDDTPINQQILTEILGPEGYSLHFAPDGESGLDKAFRLKPDLVLLDLVLPGIMGTDVLDRLKRDLPETMVILTTAYGSEETAIKALRLRVDDYIINKRPFDADEVREVVRRAVTEAYLRRENQRLQRELQIKNEELTQSYAKLQAAYEQLQALDKAKASFFSMVSHDLRHPIAVAKGYLELIQSGPAAIDDENRGYIQVAEQEMRYIAEMVDDVLDLSRMDAGYYQVDCQPLPVSSLLQQARLAFRTQAAQRNISITVKPSENLPLVSADSLRMGQVLSNLLENALKFTPEGGQIFLSAQPVNDQVQITVRDTGVGIEAGEHEKIFDRFYRIKRGEQVEDKGSGLGLAICREIVRLHGGRIWAESELGKGASFHLTLKPAES
ncbi:MAG TPA: hybrid sensor histidine kinase/response regulator [Anaerolineae bacterium]|nr:hybrid sensor histidine kinase/response regulator [Anaerolineae bacterium]